MTLSLRQLATLLAALSFWRDEMSPHGRCIMRPYFRALGSQPRTPLNRRELDELMRRLRCELRRRDS